MLGLKQVKGLILGMASVGLLVLYQNCGSKDTNAEVSSPLVYKIGGSEVFGDQVPRADRLKICEDSSNWHCTIHHFRPNAIEQLAQVKFCSQGVCAEAVEVYHDTSPALAACPDCSPEDSLSGGRYNFDETSCSNDQISAKAGPAVLGTASTGQVALTEAIGKCLSHAF